MVWDAWGSVAGPLRRRGPFMGLLYSWLAACLPGWCFAVPAILRLIRLGIAGHIQPGHAVNCCRPQFGLGKVSAPTQRPKGHTVVHAGWK
eukprot:15247329-Heterocapsa_arctica.AAC.1